MGEFVHEGCKKRHRTAWGLWRCVHKLAWNEAGYVAWRVAQRWEEGDPPFEHPGCEVSHKKVGAARECLRQSLRRRLRESFRVWEDVRGVGELLGVDELVPVGVLDEGEGVGVFVRVEGGGSG